MKTGTFFAQDQAGNMQQIRIIRDVSAHDGDSEETRHAVSFVLEDGSPLRRIDNETFQVIDTGAFITLVRP
ncbi:hypothetical protein DT603_06600 [Pseudoxanthomonas gei]|uniref:Uncharacterized protein n=1 Tax=Pseudoxanthomonas gei TaxID=1383030 RepID=A0ABX0AAK4_9GAMM|nr:hypothetical protein [Pseudoxanthomonas gei]NDK38511.1 hypothetical protein [Pseudoxanthomonas gei]